MRRALWGKVAVVVAAALAIMTLPACDDSYKINVERALLFPVSTHREAPVAIPLELAYHEFEVPANVPGILRVEFSSGTRYSTCTLSFDGSRGLEVKQDGNGTYYVEKPLPALVEGRRAGGSLTCLKPTDLSLAFTDTFTIRVRNAYGRVAARPLEVYFSSLAVGAAPEIRMVWITNLGESSISIRSIALGGTGSGSFRVGASNCRSGMLRPKDQCGVLVEFRPAGLGVFEARLEITTVPQRPTDVVRLIGTGIEGPRPIVALSPSIISFGDVPIGESRTQAVTVTSTGSAAVVLSRITLEGDPITWFSLASDSCSTTTLASGQSCSLVVAFGPNAQGSQTAELRFTSNATSSPHAIRVTGSGIPPAPAPSPTVPSCPPNYPYC